MEKSQGLTIDKEAMKKQESFKKGRAFGLRALENTTEWAEGELKQLTKDPAIDQKSFLEGAIEALVAPFQLSSLASLPVTRASALFKLLTRKDANRHFEQMQQVIQRYHDELDHLKEAIVQQLGPRLQQRAEQLARQAGVSTNYAIERDPEFLKIFNHNAEMIRQQLQDYLDRTKADLKRLA